MGWHNIKKVTAGVKELVNVNAVLGARHEDYGTDAGLAK